VEFALHSHNGQRNKMEVRELNSFPFFFKTQAIPGMSLTFNSESTFVELEPISHEERQQTAILNKITGLII